MTGKRTAISARLDDNRSWLKERLGIGVSFDVLGREFRVAGNDCYLVALDGMYKDDMLERVMAFALATRGERVEPEDLDAFLKERITYFEAERVDFLEDAVDAVLSGPAVLFVDGSPRAIVLDTRKYPQREPQEPALEKVLRGAKDGFTETLVDNTALVRRRVRDPDLRIELIKAGRRSRTDVALCYIRDVAPPELVSAIRRRLRDITTDGLPMAEKTVEEFIGGPRSWWNPFPTVRYTERPDIVAVHLLEGRIAILVDTSPVAMVLPATFFDQLEHAEEYHVQVTTGIFLRLVRYGALFLAWVLAPLYVYLVTHAWMIPPWLTFIGPKQPGVIPLFLQFVIADFGIELIRISLIHTPEALATSLGVIGAVLIGDLATKVGLLSPEAILYVTLAALGTFSIPTLELASAVRVFRLLFFFLAGIPAWWVLPVGLALNALLLVVHRSFGEPYLWPLVPLDVGALWGVLVRGPLPVRKRRPSLVSPQDPDVA